MGYIEDLRALVGHRPVILVGTVVIVVNDEGNILLQQRTYPEGVWGLPGGLMELGESTEEVGIREVYEETGLKVKQLKLINIYSGEDQFSTAANGDQFYSVTAAYFTTDYEGHLQVNREEAMACRFIDVRDLPENMVGSHRMMIGEFVDKYGSMIQARQS